MTRKPGKILVIRNDKLGDFMLAWPALSLLKQQYPEAHISVLIPSYTQPIAELCPWIDSVVIDNQRNSTLSDARHLAGLFRQEQFDAAITLFSETRTGLALWMAGIPLRLSPATKLAQLFYNRKLVQRRSRSEKPEFEYNADLVRYFVELNNDRPVTLQSAPYLTFPTEELESLKQQFLLENKIAKNRKQVFVHPGSGGSANNLTTEQYAELIRTLATEASLYFVITAGPDELDDASALSDLLDGIEHTVYHSTKGLVNFTRLIATCDLFISGSTGPLHIAGALNCRTAAFYPTRRSATSLRWQTLNDENRRLTFSPTEVSQTADMSTVDPSACGREILQKLL